MSMELLLEFAEWILSKDPGEVIGQSGDTKNCPLARWLRESRGGDWMVFAGGRNSAWKEGPFGPYWMHLDIGPVLSEFVDRIDEAARRANGGYDDFLSAGLSAGVLADCMERARKGGWR